MAHPFTEDVVAAHEYTRQRAKDGRLCPEAWARAGARLPERPGEPTQDPAFLLRWEGLEAWAEHLDPPPPLSRGELSETLCALGTNQAGNTQCN